MFSMMDVLYFSIGGAMGLVIGVWIICRINKYLDKRGYLLQNSKKELGSEKK